MPSICNTAYTMMLQKSSCGSSIRSAPVKCMISLGWPRKAVVGRLPAADATLTQPSGASVLPVRLAPVSGLRLRGLSAVAASGNGSTSQYDYDIFTIGAGSGGVRGSRFASSYGAKVAVCEMPFDYKSSDTKGGVGGTCVLRGCVPKKLLVYASQFAESFHESVGFGWEQRADPAHDWGKMIDAKRKELQRLNNAYKNTLANAKVELIEGKGTIIDAHTVEVDGRRFTAANILVAVGGLPSKPDIPGAEHCISSDDALELSTRPGKITIVGGGYIGVEFAGVFKCFGSEVNLLYRQDLPLRGFDQDVRKFAADQYAASGIKLFSGCSPTEVRKEADGKLTIVYTDAEGKKSEITGNDQVMMATGRVPNVQGLGLDRAGVKTGKKGEILVDEYSRTSVPSIWAVGDVTDRIQLTPVALMEGMAVAKTIVLGEPTKADHHAVPSAVFSHPEIGTVGLSEEAAIKAGHTDLDVYTSSFRPMKHTLSGSHLRTFMKIIVDANTSKVLGIHMMGEHAAEIMQGFAVAVKMGATKQQLDATIGIHPSAAEELVTMRSASRKVRQGALVTA